MTEPDPSSASVSRQLTDPPVPDFALNIRHWALLALLEHWRQAHRGDALPRRVDISPAQFGRAMPYVSMIDVAGEPPRYRWRLISSQVTRRLGRDLTGKWFDEVYSPEVVSRLAAVYGLSLQHRVAIRFAGQMAFAGKSHLPYEAVHMPLVNDDDRIAMLMIGVHLGRQD